MGFRFHALFAGSRQQQLAVRLVVAVPAGQGGIVGVLEKKFERQAFGMAVAENHVGPVLVAGVNPFRALRVVQI